MARHLVCTEGDSAQGFHWSLPLLFSRADLASLHSWLVLRRFWTAIAKDFGWTRSVCLSSRVGFLMRLFRWPPMNCEHQPCWLHRWVLILFFSWRTGGMRVAELYLNPAVRTCAVLEGAGLQMKLTVLGGPYRMAEAACMGDAAAGISKLSCTVCAMAAV